MTAQWLSVMSSLIIISNNGTYITRDGIIIEPMINPNTIPFPLNSNFASAYPAAENNNSASTVYTTDTNNVLKVLVSKSTLPLKIEKLFSNSDPGVSFGGTDKI